jgi:kinesin family protein C1
MYTSFLEIYNEKIRDLLSKSKDKVCDIHLDPTTREPVVPDLTVVKVDCPERVHELLKLASKNRAVGETEMNKRSSRSHSVFQLKLKGTNRVTNENCQGILNLIDLAGSERLSQSGSKGERLTETKNINKSLSCLGNVIAALANGSQHVPYRDSKLTFLLQNSLGGNSKCLMFVNISPAASNLAESLSSLNFAAKVNACEIGTARKNTKIDFNS